VEELHPPDAELRVDVRPRLWVKASVTADHANVSAPQL
jgi:hypothetical protein